ncbi:hypothetical protein BU14_0104s0009 [Porphyra umbilicalis]|uniref:Uncharacterized protein n=1 Tax=Porphyra umbilicalis TaxID=2786 RepID=A0A1X6PD24_PORUM|nr:hypothetical protein BU14_0104s0009 [Porphyra umbilicalis]|eukprot:OSX78635.1 hypothetical protein BU14_0104s0009 [Porphyra umbilicalis]
MRGGWRGTHLLVWCTTRQFVFAVWFKRRLTPASRNRTHRALCSTNTGAVTPLGPPPPPGHERLEVQRVGPAGVAELPKHPPHAPHLGLAADDHPTHARRRAVGRPTRPIRHNAAQVVRIDAAGRPPVHRLPAGQPVDGQAAAGRRGDRLHPVDGGGFHPKPHRVDERHARAAAELIDHHGQRARNANPERHNDQQPPAPVPAAAAAAAAAAARRGGSGRPIPPPPRAGDRQRDGPRRAHHVADGEGVKKRQCGDRGDSGDSGDRGDIGDRGYSDGRAGWSGGRRGGRLQARMARDGGVVLLYSAHCPNPVTHAAYGRFGSL